MSLKLVFLDTCSFSCLTTVNFRPCSMPFHWDKPFPGAPTAGPWRGPFHSFLHCCCCLSAITASQPFPFFSDFYRGSFHLSKDLSFCYEQSVSLFPISESGFSASEALTLRGLQACKMAEANACMVSAPAAHGDAEVVMASLSSDSGRRLWQQIYSGSNSSSSRSCSSSCNSSLSLLYSNKRKSEVSRRYYLQVEILWITSHGQLEIVCRHSEIFKWNMTKLTPFLKAIHDLEKICFAQQTFIWSAI